MRGHRGFTIIELLASVGVLVILVAITFPVLASIRRSQKKKRVSAAVITLGLAIESYQNDFGVFPIADLEDAVIGPGLNKGNRALVYWLTAGEAAGGRSAPYLPSAYYDHAAKQIEGDVLRDEWERPYVYFDTSAMKTAFSQAYDLRGGQAPVRPAKNATTGRYYNFGRFQLWSCGPDEQNNGGPNPHDEHNDDIGNFARDE